MHAHLRGGLALYCYLLKFDGMDGVKVHIFMVN